MSTSNTSTTYTVPNDIAKHTAPLLLGSLFNWALFGVLTVQTYVYSYNFPNDKRAVKCLAYFCFVVETVQTALNGADMYYWFIEGFGDVKRLTDSHFAPIDVPIIRAIISFPVQVYFCYRIWVLSALQVSTRRSSWICVTIVILIVSLLQAIGALWGGIQSEIEGKYIVSKIALYFATLGSAVTDVLIAVSMTLLLLRSRVEVNRPSNDILIRVVHLTVETNALTAVTATLSFILYVAYPDEIYFIFTAGIVGKMYANALIVSLNNRIFFRKHASGVFRSNDNHIMGSHPSHLEAGSRHFHHQVQVTRTTVIGNDYKLDGMSPTSEFARSKDSEGIVSVNSEQ